MKPDEFMKLQQNKINEDIYPPTDAQEGLDILINETIKSSNECVTPELTIKNTIEKYIYE